MRKNIWILNHYATNMYINRAGRHYYFAKNLIKKGYVPTVFCASTIHNTNNSIDTNRQRYLVDNVDGIAFLFVQTPNYKGNGIKRINNIISFYKDLFPVAIDFAKEHKKPDVILASSVHPLTLVAGIKIAKRFDVPCICEVRDLWPESLVAYDVLKKSNPLLKLLYAGEKWIYKNADKIIFTMEGGKDYIIEKGWDKQHGGPIDLNKVYHINNGVDLEIFDYNREHYVLEDADLSNKEIFKVVYTGSIRKANNLELIINTARYIQERYINNIRFLIYGDGDEKNPLENKCRCENIRNVIFKGRVDKKYIPYIVSKSNLNIVNYSYHDIWKYGGSQNKVFEYLAAGRPILSTITMGYDIIKKYNAGISLRDQSSESIGNAIINISRMHATDYNKMCDNARCAAQNYDYKLLTDKLISLLE